MPFDFYADLHDKAQKGKAKAAGLPRQSSKRCQESLSARTKSNSGGRLAGDRKRYIGAVDGEISAFADLVVNDEIIASSTAREIRFSIQHSAFTKVLEAAAN